MRRISIALCGVLALCLVSPVRADEEADAKKQAEAEAAFKEFSKAFAGIWKGAAEKGARDPETRVWKSSGETEEHLVNNRLLGDGKFIHHSAKIDGVEGDNVIVFGIDPETNLLTRWAFNKWGVKKDNVTKNDDGSWTTVTMDFTNNEGQKVLWKILLTSKSDNEHELSQSISVDGEAADNSFIRPPATFRRHSK